MAVAAASLSTVILSISDGLIPAIDDCCTSSIAFNRSKSGTSVPSSGIPSSTHKGSCVPLSEAVPRIRIFTGAPGAPVEGVIAIPAICPESAWSMLRTDPIIASLTSTVEIAEVSLRRSMF